MLHGEIDPNNDNLSDAIVLWQTTETKNTGRRDGVARHLDKVKRFMKSLLTQQRTKLDQCRRSSSQYRTLFHVHVTLESDARSQINQGSMGKAQPGIKIGIVYYRNLTGHAALASIAPGYLSPVVRHLATK